VKATATDRRNHHPSPTRRPRSSYSFV